MKRNKKESMICLTLKPRQSFFVYHIQSKELFFTEKNILSKRQWRIEQKKQKEDFLTVIPKGIKKDPTASIRKHNELKVLEKTVWTAIK